MLRFLLLVTILGVIYFGYDSYSRSHPHEMERFWIAIDGFGFTEAARREGERIEKINDLDIPYEKKQVLIQRNVFMGASTYMVQLALGRPQSAPTKSGYVYLVYYLENDHRPTIFIFQKDVLVKAYKGSASDFNKASQ